MAQQATTLNAPGLTMKETVATFALAPPYPPNSIALIESEFCTILPMLAGAPQVQLQRGVLNSGVAPHAAGVAVTILQASDLPTVTQNPYGIQTPTPTPAGSALSVGLAPAQSGAIRLPNAAAITWRNATNTADGASFSTTAAGGFVINAGLTPSIVGADLGAPATPFRNVYVSSAIVNKVKAGAPTDADVVNPADGMLVVDTTTIKLWVRVGGLWKGVVVA